MGVTSASGGQVKVSASQRCSRTHALTTLFHSLCTLSRTTFYASTTGLLVPLRLTEWKDLMPEFAVFCFRFCSRGSLYFFTAYVRAALVTEHCTTSPPVPAAKTLIVISKSLSCSN